MKKKNILKVFIIIVTILATIALIIVGKSAGIGHKGNAEKYSVENTESLENSPLQGKRIIFLGSSVTRGASAYGESFVDYMEKKDGIIAEKEAVTGTMLVDVSEKSYVSRLKKIDKDIDADLFVCQLSTNDATAEKPLGKVSERRNLEAFDTATVAGAMEYIICYAKETWNCPVMFYTGTKYDSSQYEAMIELLYALQKKWDIDVLDLWNNPEMNRVSAGQYKLYMVNGIHPSRAGYREWWTPMFEEYIESILL